MGTMRSPATFALALAALFAAAGSEAQPVSPRVSAVRVARDGGSIVITLQASGPLPVPAVGEVDGPPRLFFDFAGVVCEARGTRLKGDPDVRGVRAAQHTASPLVTRVVVDLVRPQVFRVETDRLAEGVLRLVGADATQPLPIAPAPPPSPTPPAETPGHTAADTPAANPPAVAAERGPDPEPAAAVNGAAHAVGPDPQPVRGPVDAPPAAPGPTPASSGPARDSGDYRTLAADPLARLLALRPLLATIDQFASPSPEELQLAADEFDRIRRVMGAISAPAPMRATHDLLLRAAALGTVATRLRAEANRTSDISQVRNAGSAAAGARLLIERACAELGCMAQ
jgi:hypothetical protein